MADHRTLWDNAERYLAAGISVIPIRDKDETIDGVVYLRKSPYRTWKRFQKEIISKEELYFLLEENKTEAIATICGKVSGNLEAIDIDVKWMAGIDQALFNELKTVNEELFRKLRINKSPSGGYHILYRVSDNVIPGNKKIASRPSTDAELEVSKEKQKCFIETRGEGGYVAAPPSVGYSIYQDVPIPTITWSEREEIHSVCSTFNQVAKEEKGYVPTKNDNKYYDENPFEHFNNSNESEQVLLNNGWTYHSKNNRALYFSRPGSQSKGIHATFLRASKLFYFFTTNSDFEPERCYKPATVLARIQFNGDKKKLYQHLVKSGYGKIKQQVERSIVKNKVLAGGVLPENASADARLQFAQLAVLNADKHPHGTYWEQNEKFEFVINREKLYAVAEALGFRYVLEKLLLVQIDGYLIHKRTERYFIDCLKAYIHEEDGDVYLQICNAFEAWMEKHAGFTITRLPLLEEESIIIDTDSFCYKFFNNGYLFITSEAIAFHTYESVTGLIWAERIQNRNFQVGAPGGKYKEFLEHAMRYETNKDYIDRAIGYLSHEHKDETTPYIIVLTEEVPDPKQGGGSGKNVFSSLFSLTTTFQSIAGSQISFDSKFLQAWNGERIFALSDVPKKFDFLFLKELSSGKGVLKKLFKDEVSVNVGDMPKFVIQTNYSYDVSDGGLKRRIIPLEFTNFFTLAGGVDAHFGCYFPTGWTSEDWCGYDNLIAESVRSWLKGGRKLAPADLSAGGTEKQFEQMYGNYIRTFFEENWEQWITEGYVQNDAFNAAYEKFCKGNLIAHPITLTRINLALAEFSKEKGYVFKKDITKRIDNDVRKCRTFVSIEPPF